MKLKLNKKQFISVILFFLLIYIFIYLLTSTLIIIFKFGVRIEKRILKLLNKNKLSNNKIKKKKLKDSSFQKDSIISIFIFLLFILILLYCLYLLNSETYKEIKNKFTKQLIINILLIIFFNVPIFIFIVMYSSNYININLS